MNVDDKVIAKLRKLLALANGRNATPAEMENAMGKAKELAMRHQIELASIKEADTRANPMDIGKDDTLKTSSQYRQPHHRHVFHVLQDCFGVKVIQTTRSCLNGTQIMAITLIGEVTDVAIAREIYPWLEALFPRQLSKLVSTGVLTYKAADMNGFYSGLYMGILKQNKREEEKLEPSAAQTWALVVRRKEDAIALKMEEEFPDLRQAKARSRRFNPVAGAIGYAKGSKINLNQVAPVSKSSQLK